MKQFELVGGELCLDFINTIHDYRAKDPGEELESFEDCVAFVKQSNAVSDRQAAKLSRQAAASPAKAQRALSAARDFRATLFRIFSAAIQEKQPTDRDWKSFNQHLSNVYAHVVLEKRDTTLHWGWDENYAGLDRFLWPVVRSAAELLTSDKKDFVRECSSETCTWMFVDVSRNHTRRWCEMQKCGNRAKWRRHYDKIKKHP